MDSTDLLPYLTNGGVALLILMLVITKTLVPGWLYTEKKAENAELKKALETERQRGDAAVIAAQATRDLLLSLKAGEKSP